MDNFSQLAKAYHASIKALANAETAYQRHSEQLEEVKAKRLPAKVPNAIALVRESEKALHKALHAASVCHREYWNARRTALLPDIYEAAELVQRYSRIAFAAGVPGSSPGMIMLQNALISTRATEIVEDVPVEGPDSEFLA